MLIASRYRITRCYNNSSHGSDIILNYILQCGLKLLLWLVAGKLSAAVDPNLVETRFGKLMRLRRTSQSDNIMANMTHRLLACWSRYVSIESLNLCYSVMRHWMLLSSGIILVNKIRSW
ncbi:unnamed protein product [Blumeria hordei]|uniref:Uncharacterized protein n=1 Tax=Blumeria hordei TaxID=2867405 RepID=A0A383V1N0_BLUHO|nr:unnamed protein product [Blumeria hordei]